MKRAFSEIGTGFAFGLLAGLLILCSSCGDNVPARDGSGGEVTTVESALVIPPGCTNFDWAHMSRTRVPEANAIATWSPALPDGTTSFPDPAAEDTIEVTPSNPPTAEFYRLDNNATMPTVRFADMAVAVFTPLPNIIDKRPVFWPGVVSGCQTYLRQSKNTTATYPNGVVITIPTGTLRIYGTNQFDSFGVRKLVQDNSYNGGTSYTLRTTGTITQ